MISPSVLNIPHVLMISPMYLWYPHDVLNVLRCTHDVPPMYLWYSNALGNRTSPDRSEVKAVRFTPYRIDMLHICFGLPKETWPQVQDSDKEIPFQIGTDPLNSLFTLGAERSKKLSDTERVTFRIGVFLVISITKNRAGPVATSVNRRAIRYGFRGTPIIDPIKYEHDLCVHFLFTC